MSRRFDLKLTVGLGLVAAIIVASAVLAYRNISRLDDDAARVAHTHEVLDLTNDVLLTLVDAETGVRGYILSRRDEYLQPYDAATKRLDGLIKQLEEKTADDPAQHARMNQFIGMANVYMDEVRGIIPMPHRTREETRALLVAAGKANTQMNAIRELMANMKESEQTALAVRKGRIRRTYVMAAASTALAAALGFVMVAAYYVLLRRSLLAQVQATAHISEQREWLHTTLASIGDGVIATDRQKRIVFLNSVAESMTGWTESTATGQSLDDVFRIVDEQNRATVESPAQRVLRDSVVVGLANHTVLIGKDGTERPIDDSAAPIRDGKGRVIGCVLVFRDITERRQAEQALRESEERFRTLADNMSQFAWMADEKGWTFWYNRRWFEYTGTTLNDMEGWGWTKVQHPDHVDRVVAGIREAWNSGKPWEDVFPMRSRAGYYRWFLSRALPICDATGKVIRWFGTNTDITEQRLAEEALREADRRKDQFVATLSHELRNPLAPLRNSLQILRMAGHDPNTREECLGTMERQLGQIVRLVDDLLDVARISRGMVTLRTERIELAAAVQNAVETARPQIDEAAHELIVTLPSETIGLEADPTRLAQIIANLLTNAAKYTDKGGRIWLTAEDHGSDLVLSVRDTGIGIAAEDLPYIFEIFAQAESALQRTQGGLGIGLALVRGLVELHGGTVQGRSDGPGKGSEFLVRLPIASRTLPAPPEPAKDCEKPAAPLKCRILVVDDNRDAADTLAMMLRLMGHEIHTAHDGLEAVQSAATLRPQVIVLDIGLPKMNGYEAARHIRAQPGGDEVLLIALTGWGQDEDKRRANMVGFDHHLTKPVNPATLEELIADFTPAMRM